MSINVVILFFGTLLLAACGNANNGKVAVQHDTLSSDNVSSGVKDSIIANGEYIKHYKNGVIEMRGMMKDGKRDGLWKSWYQDGLPWSETTFKDGIKEGPTVTYYENGGKRYEGFYSNDEEYGKWIFYDEKGNVTQTQTFERK
jgi:antitoxin component YwqK of YwqJK toxin-antitoxin module